MNLGIVYLADDSFGLYCSKYQKKWCHLLLTVYQNFDDASTAKLSTVSLADFPLNYIVRRAKRNGVFYYWQITICSTYSLDEWRYFCMDTLNVVSSLSLSEEKIDPTAVWCMDQLGMDLDTSRLRVIYPLPKLIALLEYSNSSW